MVARVMAIIAVTARSMAGRLGARLVRWSGSGESQPHGERRDDADAPDSADHAQDEPAAPGIPDATSPDRSIPQLATTGVSLLLIVLLTAAILYDGYAGHGSAPAAVEVEVAVGEARQDGGVFYIPFEARNTGDQTIEQALIVFEARDGDEVVEETETVIPLLGERGSISGVLVLDRDPTGLDIEARVLTYQIAEE